MSEIPEAFTETYGFRLDGQKDGIKVFDEAVDFENPVVSSLPLNLLAVGNIKKVYIASNAAKVVIGRVESLEEDRKYIDLPNTTNVSINADNEHVYFVVDGTLKRASTDDLLLGTQNLTDVLSEVKDFKPSPTVPGLGAALLKSGGLSILNDGQTVHSIDDIDGLAWDIEGTAVGTVSKSSFAVYKADGSKSSSYTDEENTYNALTPLSDGQWLLMSSPTPEDAIYTLLVEEDSNFTTFDVPLAPPFGEVERVLQLYATYLQNWIEGKTLTIVSTALSTEINTLQYDGQKSELIGHANDTDRAELPMDDDSGDDTLPIGLAIDITGTTRIVKEPCEGVEEANGVLPRLFCLNNVGNMVVWDVFESKEIHNEGLSLQRALPELKSIDLGSSSQKDPVSLGPFSAPSVPAEKKEEEKAKPAAPPASPVKPAFGSGDFGSSTTSSSGFGQLGFASGGGGFGESGFGKSGFGQKSENKGTNTSEVKSGFGSYASKSNAFNTDSKASPFGASSSTNDIFGSQETNNDSLKPSIFGESSGAKPFGSSSESKSIFGESSSAKPFGSSTETKSIFGQPTNAKPFGSSSENTSGFGSKPFGAKDELKPAFGSPSSSTGFDSSFGEKSQEASEDKESSSPFGTSSKPSPFGQFGSQNKTSGQSSLSSGFGNLSVDKTPPGSPLQVTKADEDKSPFGEPTEQSSPFGRFTQEDKAEDDKNKSSSFGGLIKPGLALKFEGSLENKPSPFGFQSSSSPFASLQQDKSQEDLSSGVDDESPSKQSPFAQKASPFDALNKNILEKSSKEDEETTDEKTLPLEDTKGLKSSLPADKEEEEEGEEEGEEQGEEQGEEEGEGEEESESGEELADTTGNESASGPSVDALPKPSFTPASDEVKTVSVTPAEPEDGQDQNDTTTKENDLPQTPDFKEGDSQASDLEEKQPASPPASKPIIPEDSSAVKEKSTDVGLKSPQASPPKEEEEEEEEVVPPLEDIELRVFASLGKLKNEGTKVEQEMRSVLQTTDAMTKVLRLNARKVDEKIRALDYDKDTTDYRRLGTAKNITEEGRKKAEEASETLGTATELNSTLQDLLKLVEESDEKRKNCERLLYLVSKYEKSFKPENTKNRPLEIRGEMLKLRLREKLEKVERLYDEALKKLLPLSLEKRSGHTLVDKLEEVIFEINSKIRLYSSHISAIEGQIKDLQGTKLIEDGTRQRSRPQLSFLESKWAYAKKLATHGVVEDEL